MQSKQDLWLQHRNMIMQNPNKFDAEEWSVYDNIYRTTGEYPLVAPPIKARSIDMALEDNPVIGNEQPAQTMEETRGGLRGFVDVRYSGTEEQARQRVKDVALMDEAYTKDLVKQFQQLDETTKLKYLDADKNGMISRDEAKDFNPIIKWAQDTKWQTALKRDELAWRKTEVTRSTFDRNLGITIKNNQNDQFEIIPDRKIGQVSFKRYYHLGIKNYVSAPLQIGEYTLLSTGEKKTLNQQALFKVVGYSSDKDMLIVEIRNDVINEKNPENSLWPGTAIGLDASEYNKLLENKTFNFSREAAMAITTPTETETKHKLKFNSLTGKFE